MLERKERFDASRLTVMYVHGYLENRDVESVHVIVEAYLRRNDINLLVLDWGTLADGNYMFDAVVNAKQVNCIKSGHPQAATCSKTEQTDSDNWRCFVSASP